MAAKDLCRKHYFSDAAIYDWRAKCGRMHIDDAKRLKALESENAKCSNGASGTSSYRRRHGRPGPSLRVNVQRAS
jgi:hypothetical protein